MLFRSLLARERRAGDARPGGELQARGGRAPALFESRRLGQRGRALLGERGRRGLELLEHPTIVGGVVDVGAGHGKGGGREGGEQRGKGHGAIQCAGQGETSKTVAGSGGFSWPFCGAWACSRPPQTCLWRGLGWARGGPSIVKKL